jgi:hypothetical protein
MFGIFQRSWSHILIPLFRPFVTGPTNRDDVGDEGTSSTPLLLRRSLWAHSSSAFHLITLIAFVLYGMRHSFNNLIHYMLPKLYLMKTKLTCFMCFYVILYCYYWYFVSSWNQTGVLHSKLIPTFVKVSWFPTNKEHRHCTVYFSFPATAVWSIFVLMNAIKDNDIKS